MWGGGAFSAAFNKASEAAKASVAAIATGTEKVGVAAKKIVTVAAGKAVDAAKWVKDETVAAAKWVKDEAVAAAKWVAKKSVQAYDAAVAAAKKVKEAFVKLKDAFVEGVKATAAFVACTAAAVGSALIAPKVRRAPKPTSCSEAKALLERHTKAKEMADMSDDVYDADSKNPKRVGGPNMAPRGLENAVFVDEGSGFKAALYKNDDGNYVLAFAGTEDAMDWKENLKQAAGIKSKQYKQAVLLAEKVQIWASQQQPPATVECTGHSLGGGLAATAGMSNGLKATTFNMARPSANTMAEFGIDPDEAGKNVDHYYVEGEVLTGAQEQAGMLAGGVALATGSVGAMALGEYAQYSIGSEVGNQESLPAVDPSTLNLIGFNDVNALDRHKLPYVKGALQNQLYEDQTTKTRLCGS